MSDELCSYTVLLSDGRVEQVIRHPENIGICFSDNNRTIWVSRFTEVEEYFLLKGMTIVDKDQTEGKLCTW